MKLHRVLRHHPVGTHEGIGEHTVSTEGNKEAREREGGREVIDDGGRKVEGSEGRKER